MIQNVHRVVENSTSELFNHIITSLKMPIYSNDRLKRPSLTIFFQKDVYTVARDLRA
jgi:hypothetical protein